MTSIIIITLLVNVVQSNAREQTASSSSTSQDFVQQLGLGQGDFVQQLGDNLADRLFDGVLELQADDLKDLHEIALGKLHGRLVSSRTRLKSGLILASHDSLPLTTLAGGHSHTAVIGDTRRQALRTGVLDVSPSRRQFLWLLNSLATAMIPGAAKADVTADVKSVAVASSQLKALASDIKKYTVEVASETSDVKLPAQISFRTFQMLAKSAHDVTLRPAAGDDAGVFLADEFLDVASQYAEHASAARDYFKLSKLGRLGEGGSDDVARAYAEKSAEEVLLASTLLEVLSLSLQ